MSSSIDKSCTSSLSAVEIFAKNVRAYRKRCFGSVREAHKKTGISIPRWYRIEQGRHPGIMDGGLIDKLAKCFGVPPSRLLNDEESLRTTRPTKRRKPGTS